MHFGPAGFGGSPKTSTKSLPNFRIWFKDETLEQALENSDVPFDTVEEAIEEAIALNKEFDQTFVSTVPYCIIDENNEVVHKSEGY